jgi:glycosyltransferase involved in cell wall biosynthesis
VGVLSPEKMIELYGDADGLLFLSTHESYGFPLIEAMYMNLPIICPDLPYARTICGDEAIYFDPYSLHSLHDAITDLYGRLIAGWSPNWVEQLKRLPRDWNQVSAKFITVACA